ncbi:hypothetical protein AJ79_01197 [Helicocarpus griseus UAMH5409]|uniref:rRNA-processing protein EFG1 n=1 Tax=Helicocarpus griseus UAMH5409 TaxID=1447875 RepID=A0A2B7Y8F3_9EURO|nr:hypothetical protein AJ79_01197 [Helicocarpus griseus UAMH5409]
MSSLRKQEKRKDMEDDSTFFETSKRHRSSDRGRDSREASPKAARNQRNDDDRRKYRDRRDPKDSRKQVSVNSREQLSPNPYTRAHERRDDRAYAAGRATVEGPDLPAASVLKGKIRDIKRLLSRTDKLPADVRIEKERALLGYQRDLEIVEAKKKRSAMIKKYHFVRFLERKTATRQLKKLLRQKKDLTESNSETLPDKQTLDALEEQIYTTRVDLNYSIYCPLTEKYISLYPTNQRSDKDGNNSDNKQPEPEPEDSHIIRNSSGEKPPLWYTVEQCMKDGTLDLLRDGALGIGISGQKKVEAGQGESSAVLGRRRKEDDAMMDVDGKKRGERGKEREREKGGKKQEKQEKGKKGSLKNNAGAKRDEGNDDDEESDGGFFEEI